MSREPSTARYISLRINPKASDYEKEFLRVLDELKEQGFSAKHVILDAVLARDGYTPEMFAESIALPSLMLARMERLFDEFAKHIISSIQREGITAVSQQMTAQKGDTTSFTRNFVKGLKSRSQDKD